MSPGHVLHVNLALKVPSTSLKEDNQSFFGAHISHTRPTMLSFCIGEMNFAKGGLSESQGLQQPGACCSFKTTHPHWKLHHQAQRPATTGVVNN